MGSSMAMIKKSITVTDKQAAWIQDQIEAGHFGSDSEVIRDALREKQLRLAEVEALRQRLRAAEQSGFSDKSPTEILATVKR